MALDVWPIETFPVDSLRWNLRGASIDGGPSLSGPGQKARGDGGGWWECLLDGSMLTTPAHYNGWRSLIAVCDGGSTAIEVPVLDYPQSPAVTNVPHGDGTPFSDSSLYVSNVVVAKLAAAALLRATSVQITVVSGGQPLTAGQFFSIVHATQGVRLYLVRRVTATSGATYTCDIRPPLREAAAINTATEFDRPRCTMALVPDPNGAEWPTVTAPWESRVSARFAETFQP